MSSRKDFSSGSSNDSSKGNRVAEGSNPNVDQLNASVSDMKLHSVPDGDWVVYSKKPKGKAVGGATNAYGSQKVPARGNGGWGNGSGSAWPNAHNDSRRPTGRENVRPPPPPNHALRNKYNPPAPVQAPLKQGRNWAAIAGSGASNMNNIGTNMSAPNGYPAGVKDSDDDEDEDDDDAIDDSDDDLASDESDSDVSQKSHDTCKKSRWFQKFFETLDGLSQVEINEPGRQWHCPACQGGPGAIDWYRGLQPLMTHAETKGAKRVKLHRTFAGLLDEELFRRGTSAYPSGEAFGRWKGLNPKTTDYEIVWPPMVIVMNTKLEKDETDKWLGMGNQELLDYFKDYAAIKARHSYGPLGHRGMSLLIFEGTAVGYSEAERLHKHFHDQGTDREAWERRRVLFYPGGQRQLYGFLASKEDMDNFNQHCQGKTKLKFEMKSHHQMVVIPLKQMSEDNQQLIWLKNKVVKEQKHSKALEESFGIVTQKLRQTMEENRIVRQRTKWQHEEYRQEMDSQEEFYKEQMKVIYEARDARDDKFELDQQVKREKVMQLNAYPSLDEDSRARESKIQDFIKSQDTEIQEFVAERDRVAKLFEAKKGEMKKRHWEEEMQLEKEYDAELSHLMETYATKVDEAAA